MDIQMAKVHMFCVSFVSLLSTTLIFVFPAKASLVPVLDVQVLCDKADVVAVGGITNTWQVGYSETLNIAGQSVEVVPMAAELNPEKVLKGTITTAKLTFRWWIPPPMGFRGIGSNQFGVFFLRESHGLYEILDPYHPFLPTIPGAPATTGGCVDQVTAELAYTVSSVEASGQAKTEALDALETVRTAAASETLKSAARSSDADTRMMSIAALVARGDMEWLEAAADSLLSQGGERDTYGAQRVLEAIRSTVKDSLAIPTLTRLLTGQEVRVRLAAATALRRTRVDAAIRPLTKALEDGDREVQYQAVIGLAEVSGTIGQWAPAEDTFLKDPQAYLDHWLAWAKSRDQRN